MFLKRWISKRVDKKYPMMSREKLREEVLSRHDAIGGGIAQRFVRGNVNIKGGDFLTKKDIEARKRATPEFQKY